MGKNSLTDTAIRDLGILFGVGAVGGLSDGQLLGRFVEGREQAVFEAIVLRHGPMVWGVCRRVLRDHHDAEDAFQATFLVLARKAASIADRGKLGNWLYGVAYQTAMKARAKRAKRRGREGQASDMPEPTVMHDELRDDLAESLDQELSRLPEKHRLPVILCDLEGKTHREAAEQLGWPIGTVSGRLSRARAMLASRLARRGVSLPVGSLAVLLAQESASASMPTRLIGSTAQAASLFAAGGAQTAGVVSAEVVALSREVLKMMLLSKIKVVMAMLLALGIVTKGALTSTQRGTVPPVGGEAQPAAQMVALRSQAKGVASGVTVSSDHMSQDTFERLAMTVDWTFIDNNVSLEGVLFMFREGLNMPKGIPIYVDPISLKEAGITMRTPVNFVLHGAPLRTALYLMLRELGLTYGIMDGVIVIASKDGMPKLLEEMPNDPPPSPERKIGALQR